MHFFLTSILITSLIYYTEAGQCHIHNYPKYLSTISNTNNENTNEITVSDFANNIAILLGLTPDQTTAPEQPLFYSSRPFEIPSTTWLFHVEGIDKLTDNGIPLADSGEFNIDSISSKLNEVGNKNALNIVSISIDSKSDLDNLEQTLKTELSKVNEQAPIKYVAIVCDDCEHDKASEKLQTQLKTVINQVIAKDPQTLAMTLATKQSARVRRARQVTGVSNNVTIATMYSDNYPVMFNLFFWTALTLAVIVIAIVYVFLTLDPGADTIIYRMTAPRLKVD